jgi:hypothetical protein
VAHEFLKKERPMGRKTVYATIILLLFGAASAFAQWQPVGGGVDYHVFALQPHNGLLYAAGNFFNAEGKPARLVAGWNGSSWSGVGGGLRGTFAVTLAEFHGDLYAGGNLTNISADNPVTYVARWNDTAWVAAGNPGVINVAALCVFQDHLYAGGDGGLARLDDTGWAKLPALGWIDAMAVYDNGLYLGGIAKMNGQDVNLIAKWDGNSFADAGGGVFDTLRIGEQVHNQASVNVLAVYQGALYAGGSFKTAGGKPATNIAKWNGSEWSALGEGADKPVLGLTVFKDQLFAAGLFAKAGGIAADGAAAWNGAAWNSPAPGLGAGGSALAVYQDELYCGGTFIDPPRKGVAKWSGVTAVNPAGRKPRARLRPWSLFSGFNALGRLLP